MLLSQRGPQSSGKPRGNDAQYRVARQIERKRGEEDDRERGRLAEIVIENQKFIEEADRIGDRHPREGGGKNCPNRPAPVRSQIRPVSHAAAMNPSR